MMSWGTTKLRRGDTLIEVVFALAILATLLTVLTTSAIASWRTSRLAGERTQASAYVQEQVEALKAYRASKTWGDFTATVPAQNGGSFHMFTESRAAVGGGYNWWWVVKPGTYNPRNFTVSIVNNGTRNVAAGAGEVMKLTVTATWSSYGATNVNKSDQIVEVGESQ